MPYVSQLFQWEFQDPKMEVLYDIRPYFGGISPEMANDCLVCPGMSNREVATFHELDQGSARYTLESADPTAWGPWGSLFIDVLGKHCVSMYHN